MTSPNNSNPPPLDLRRRSAGRRRFAIGSFGTTFQVPPRLMEAFYASIGFCVDSVVWLMGPVLICFASGIIYALSYTFFAVLLPMLVDKNKDSPILGKIKLTLHVSYVIFILVNVLYNYFLCVMTSNKGPSYDRVVRELADATGYNYPETPAEVSQAKRDYEEKMFFYTQRRQARERRNASNNNNNNSSSGGTVTQRQSASSESNNNNSNVTEERIHRWTLMSPDEWGFCHFSNQPKPPRSHYDHVTKCLVLNMDHFCPWMFNTVGYLNYRYFCNFLFYVACGMLYGTIVTMVPFLEISGSSSRYYQQVRESRNKGLKTVERLYPMVPLPNERTTITFSCMMCLAVGFAVLCLAGFHFYLVLTAQTTIEFHGNCASKRRAKKRKQKWVNPYDLGRKRNWQQVYGTRHPLIALLPSSREPEFLPIPIAGELGRRHPKSKDAVARDSREIHAGPDVSGNATQRSSGLAEVV